MNLSYKIWSPHMWFSLMTLCISYPKTPTDLVKKQYYTYIHNLPLFYPYDSFDTRFEMLIKQYPLLPYLDSNVSFLKWLNFIQNKTNELYDIKPQPLNDSITEYYRNFETEKERKTHIQLKSYFTIVAIMILLIIFLHR